MKARFCFQDKMKDMVETRERERREKRKKEREREGGKIKNAREGS